MKHLPEFYESFYQSVKSEKGPGFRKFNFFANSDGSVGHTGTQYFQLMSEVEAVLWTWALHLWSLTVISDSVWVEMNCSTSNWCAELENYPWCGKKPHGWCLKCCEWKQLALISFCLVRNTAHFTPVISFKSGHSTVQGACTSHPLLLPISSSVSSHPPLPAISSILPSQHPERALYIQNLMMLLVLETNSLLPPLWNVLKALGDSLSLFDK